MSLIDRDATIAAFDRMPKLEGIGLEPVIAMRDIKAILEAVPDAYSPLNWITPEQGREDTYKKLYLAYCPGYPLIIADWRTGYGYRDVRTGESIHPTRVAYINLPD